MTTGLVGPRRLLSARAGGPGRFGHTEFQVPEATSDLGGDRRVISEWGRGDQAKLICVLEHLQVKISL